MRERLLNVARYLATNGFYKEAAQIKKIAEEESPEEKREKLIKDIKEVFQSGRATLAGEDTKLHLIYRRDPDWGDDSRYFNPNTGVPTNAGDWDWAKKIEEMLEEKTGYNIGFGFSDDGVDYRTEKDGFLELILRGGDDEGYEFIIIIQTSKPQTSQARTSVMFGDTTDDFFDLDPICDID